MPCDLEILHEMMKKNACIELEEEHNKKVIKLNESNTSILIKNPPPDSLVIKADLFEAADSIFYGKKGECKRADFIIISVQERVVLYIEMKKTKDPFNSIINQLAGSQCFMKYCREVGKFFWKEPNFLKDYKQRFITIGHLSIAKKKTRATKLSSIHDRPESPLKIDWPHYLQFHHLAALKKT